MCSKWQRMSQYLVLILNLVLQKHTCLIYTDCKCNLQTIKTSPLNSETIFVHLYIIYTINEYIESYCISYWYTRCSKSLVLLYFDNPIYLHVGRLNPTVNSCVAFFLVVRRLNVQTKEKHCIIEHCNSLSSYVNNQNIKFC